MTPTPGSDIIQSRLREVHAAGRITDVLLGVALDVLHPFAADYLSADDYRRLIATVEAPVKDAAERGLATLAEELAGVISEVDSRVIDRPEGFRRSLIGVR
jgi:hypothetical protein